MTVRNHLMQAPLFAMIWIGLLICPTLRAATDTTLPTIPIDTQAPTGKVVSYRATPDVPTSRSDPFNRPEDDGRPGEYFFYLGALANQRHE